LFDALRAAASPRQRRASETFDIRYAYDIGEAHACYGVILMPMLILMPPCRAAIVAVYAAILPCRRMLYASL